MNKKGLSTFVSIILGFSLVAITFLFTILLVYETGQDYIISPTADIGKDILANTTVLPAAQGVDTITQLESDYNDLRIPYDLFFLLGFLTVFSSTMYSAWTSKREGIFSFFGYIFMGSVLLLLITSYLAQFNDWFQVNVVDTMFADSSVSMPLLTLYLGNMALIHFVWWILLVLINNLDKSFISRTGEVEQ